MTFKTDNLLYASQNDNSLKRTVKKTTKKIDT